MPRHKDVQWNLPEGTSDPKDGGRIHGESIIQIALLMDIRDELKALNRVFNCDNFLSIPRSLRAIRRNTSKPKRKK